MGKTAKKRLDREQIIAAALRISDVSMGHGVAISGRALGEALGVDRSAIWRHFRDQDDLLLAANDALLGVALQKIQKTEPVVDLLREIWRQTVASALKHPHLAVTLGGSFNNGPHTLATMEMVLEGFIEAGLQIAEAALEYRAFIDMTLAYAAMVAHYSLISPESARTQETLFLQAALSNSTAKGKVLRPALPYLVQIDEKAGETVIDTYLTGLAHRLKLGQ